MIELLRTNDFVLISFIESLFKEDEIPYFVADQNMSLIEGSIGAISRRIMVESSYIAQAKRLLKDAGLEKELKITNAK